VQCEIKAVLSTAMCESWRKRMMAFVGYDNGLQSHCFECKRELIMVLRFFVSALVAYAVLGSGQIRAQESLVSYKSLAPEIALELAQAALANCQQRGYQVAIAVVDRFGVIQVVLRDRYAGPHTPATASGKAWTAATFRSSTSNLLTISQPGMMQAGIRNLPGAVIIGGGLVVESGGSLVGAIGVSGAPGGDADEACAKAGIEAIQSKLDF
jgi:uncharacterized protein GlcG (DUF336 family)